MARFDQLEHKLESIIDRVINELYRGNRPKDLRLNKFFSTFCALKAWDENHPSAKGYKSSLNWFFRFLRKTCPEIWIIGGLHTRPEYRNQGYAASITSIMIKDALKETEYIGLYVREDNYPAKRVYQKTGFKSYNKIELLDHNTGLVIQCIARAQEFERGN